MRWIFYCLIIANFAFFIWQLQSVHIGPAGGGSSLYFQERLPDGEILVLLSERIGSPGSQAAGAEATASVTKELVKPVAPEQSVAPQDVPPSAADMLGVAEAPDNNVPVVEEPSLKCYQAGPFADEVDQEQALSALRAQRYEAVAKIVDRGVEKEHWVLIPPIASRPEALDVLQTLKQLKIDSYLVTEGEYRNAISLGLFVREGSAVGVAERVASLGYETEVRIKERPKSEYWVEVRTLNELPVVLRLLENNEGIQRDIKILKSGCEMFAH